MMRHRPSRGSMQSAAREGAAAASAAAAAASLSALPPPSSPLQPLSRFHSHIMPALVDDADAEESARALAAMHVIPMRREQDLDDDEEADPRARARRAAANADDSSGGESTDPDDQEEEEDAAATAYEYFPADSDPAALATLDQLPASWRTQPAPPVSARAHAPPQQQQRSANLMAQLHPPQSADGHAQGASDEDEEDDFASFNQRRAMQQKHRRMTGRGRAHPHEESKQQLGALGATAAHYLLSTPSSSRSSRSMHSTEHLSPRAAAQARSASAAAMAAAASSIPVRPSTARRSATDVMRASTVFAQSRAAATAAVARPSSATVGFAPDGTKVLIKPVLTPEEAVAQYALQQHEARLAGIAEAEARLDANMAEKPRELIAANQSAQVQLLQRLAHEMSSTATEMEDEFGSGSGQLSAHAAKKAAAHHRERARGLSLVGVRAPQEEGTLAVLRNVSGWIESRSVDGLMSDSSLLSRAEQQSTETELVRLDAERALRGVVDRITLSPPLRIELLSKLQSTTAQALVDHNALIETLKRNLWKARYYLRDAVHTFEAEIAALKSNVQDKSDEIAQLQQHEIENHQLRLERAQQNEAAKEAAKEMQSLRSELAALTFSTLHSREEMSRLLQNDSILRAQRDRAVEAEHKSSAQLSMALDRANFASDLHRALTLKVAREARGLKLKEAQLDAVNEMFRSRRELIAKLREQKKREEEEAAAKKKKQEDEEQAAAAAAAAAEGSASSTFLTEPKPDAASASASSPSLAAAPLPDASTLLLHHVRVNKKLYRLLQLHPENAARRPDLLLELKGWILAAERQLRISMSRAVEAASESRMSLSEIALLKLEQIRLLDEQRSKFRFLHETELHASESPDQRAAREALEAQENEALLSIIAQDRGASSEEEEEEERLRLREEYLSSSVAEGGEPVDEEQLAQLMAEQDALDATEVQRMTDVERAARLRRAIERTSMTPADAKLDRRLERAEIREAKRRRRAELRAAQSRANMRQIDAAAREEVTAGAAGGAGEIDQAEGELQRLMHEAALKSPSALSRLPSYMSPTGRRRSRRSVSPTGAGGAAGSKSKASPLVSPRRSTAKAEAARARRKTQEDALALQRLLAQMDAAAAVSKQSKLKAEKGKDKDHDKDKDKVGSPLKSPRASTLSAGRRRARGKKSIANFVFADSDDEPTKAELSSAESSDEEEHGGEEGQPPSGAKATGGEASESEALSDPGAASSSKSKAHKGKNKKPASAADAPQSSPFLAAAYRTAPAAAPAKVAEAFWPGSSFFVAPQDPAEAAKQKADFEALVARTAQAQLDVWLAERRAREAQARRHVSTQCPANLVSLDEMHVLEHFCEMPNIEAPEATKSAELPGAVAKIDTGLGGRSPRSPSSAALVPSPSSSPTHASASSLPAASSGPFGSHRTVGVQVGIPPAFSHVAFYRWYLDGLLASLKQPVRGAVVVPPVCSLYAYLGADKFDSLETATMQALNLIVPFDLTAGLRALDNGALLEAPRGKTNEDIAFAAAAAAGSKNKGNKKQQQQQAEDPVPPFHPLGMDGSERLVDAHVIPDVPPAKGPPSRPHRRLRSDGTEELQSDAELHSFIDALETLPEVDPRAGALLEPAGELTAAELEAKRQREMSAIIALVARIDRAKRVKTATLTHRKHTLRFLEGGLSEAPPALDKALAQIDRDRPEYNLDRPATQWDAALAAMDGTHGYSADRSNRPPPSSIDGTRLTSDLQGTRWHRSIVMPTPGAAYDVSAIPMVALHQESQASQTDAAAPVDPAAHTGPVAPRKRHPILTHHFAPVPFHLRSYPMRAPVVPPGSDAAGMPNVLQELAERNAREGRGAEAAGAPMVVTADRRPTSADAGSSTHRGGVGSTSSSTSASSPWMESVRDRLWAAQESLVRRRRQLLRAMVAPEGATVTDHEPQSSPRARSSKSARSATHAALQLADQQQSAATYRPTPAQQSHAAAAARAFQKLETFAQLRESQKAAAAAEEKSAPPTTLPAVPSASAAAAAAAVPPRSRGLGRRSSLLDRLVAQEDALRSAEEAAAALAEQSREHVQVLARRASGQLAPTAATFNAAPSAQAAALVPQPPAAVAPSHASTARSRPPTATVGGHLRRHKQTGATTATPAAAV